MQRALLVAIAVTLAAPAAAQEAALRELLLSNAWCSFSYNQTTGASRTERAQFAANGTLHVSSGAQSHSSGPYGSTAGQSSTARTWFWKVERGDLHLSEDRATWESLGLDVRRNANGSVVLVTDGREYAQCR
jgi:hypothetical protein